MIIFIPTKRGTGVKVYGDYGDLRSLYDTFAKLSEENKDIAGRQRNKVLGNMSYEVFQAIQNHRPFERYDYGIGLYALYYSFYIDWMTLLFTPACLRYNAMYTMLDEKDLSNLLLLEYNCKEAIKRYDPQSYVNIEWFINGYIKPTYKSIYFSYQYAVKDLLLTKAGKQRFRKIPEIIELYCNIYGARFKELEKDVDDLIQDSDTNLEDYEIEIPPYPDYNEW